MTCRSCGATDNDDICFGCLWAMFAWMGRERFAALLPIPIAPCAVILPVTERKVAIDEWLHATGGTPPAPAPRHDTSGTTPKGRG